MRIACKKLRGMFAFAIYDKTKRKLILARDRLGKKPLHYALHDGKLYFGSEIKSILAVAPELAEVNSQALLEYLYFGYVPDPITAFTGIQKLPPGHLLEFENGKIRDPPVLGSCRNTTRTRRRAKKSVWKNWSTGCLKRRKSA